MSDEKHQTSNELAYAEAAEILQKALELMPDHILIYYNLGLIYQYLGEVEFKQLRK